MTRSKRARPSEPKSQWPVSTHLSVALRTMTARRPAEDARQLSDILGAMAKELDDPATPATRRKWLEDHIERLWHYELFGSEGAKSNAQIVTLVAAVAVSARARERDVKGERLYLNAGLQYFHVRYPVRAACLANRSALTTFHAAVLAWNKRGPNADKWKAIAKLAESIGLCKGPEQIRRLWEDAQRNPRDRNSVGS